jgi:TolA-binding protein
MTGDVVAAVSLLFAAIAAGCAAWAIREARASGREQHRATQQLQATVTTLGEVLTQATQLVELQRQSLDAARSSGEDLASAAATLEKVLDQERELAELQKQAVEAQRAVGQEAGLRHRLDVLADAASALLELGRAIVVLAHADLHRELSNGSGARPR